MKLVATIEGRLITVNYEDANLDSFLANIKKIKDSLYGKSDDETTKETENNE